MARPPHTLSYILSSQISLMSLCPLVGLDSTTRHICVSVSCQQASSNWASYTRVFTHARACD